MNLDQQTVKINVESKKDSYGRRHFTTYWLDSEGKKRGQCFHSNVEKQEAYWRRNGKTTVLISDMFFD